MKITGKVLIVFEAQVKSDRFSSREFVLEYVENPMYPQTILLQLVNDKTSLISQEDVGKMKEVHFNLKGRSWTSPQGETKYFNSLDAWKILDVPAESSPPPPPPVASTSDDDDLPF